MTPDQHKARLLELLEPPTTWHWWPYVEQRASELAADPELANLPALVKAEYVRLWNVHVSNRHGPVLPSTNQPRRSE